MGQARTCSSGRRRPEDRRFRYWKRHWGARVAIALALACGPGKTPADDSSTTTPDANPSASRRQVPQRLADTPEYLKLEQSWNHGPYCGPNSLYVLARLVGVNASLNDVLHRFQLDPQRGCTIEQLERVSSAIGCDACTRFVSPSQLEHVDPPFILHLAQSELDPTTGHFLTVCRFDPAVKRYGTIDGTSGLYHWREADSIYRSFSGYILVPVRRPAMPLVPLLKVGLYVVVATDVGLLGLLALRARRTHASL